MMISGLLLLATVVSPKITDEVLQNPDMGLCYYQYSNRFWAYSIKDEPADQPVRVPGTTVAYMRIQWVDIEPTEGDIRWDTLDAVIQNYARLGKQSAFRFVVSNPTTNATPEWVRQAGAKYTDFTHRYIPKGQTRWEPVFDDPVFLEKYENFLRAYAARYDGDPNVAFLDIGSFGMYGEGHTCYSVQLSQQETDRIAKIHIDMHLRCLKNTYLVISDDVSGAGSDEADPYLMRYCREHGVGFRDDSIFCFDRDAYAKGYMHDNWARLFAPTLPVVVETGHYCGKDDPEWRFGELVRCAEDYRASYFSIHGYPEEVVAHNQTEYDVLARRVGYRFEPRRISYPESVRIDEPVTVESTWVNSGTAQKTKPATLAWSLTDAHGAVVWSCTDDAFDFRSLEPTIGGAEKPVTVRSRCRFGRTVPIPQDSDGMLNLCRKRGYAIGGEQQLLKPGRYTLNVSVGSRSGTPQIALPLENGVQRRYPVGPIDVR